MAVEGYDPTGETHYTRNLRSYHVGAPFDPVSDFQDFGRLVQARLPLALRVGSNCGLSHVFAKRVSKVSHHEFRTENGNLSCFFLIRTTFMNCCQGKMPRSPDHDVSHLTWLAVCSVDVG
jgi:hypothetical protein